MSFRKRVREEMKFQGLTAKELAAKAEISVNTLNLYIGYRESMPSAEVGLKIAKALNVSLNYLVNGTNIEPVKIYNPIPQQKNEEPTVTEKKLLQKQLLSLTNSMTKKQLENFLQVTRLFMAS